MRRYSFIMILVFSFILASCSNSPQKSNEEQAQTNDKYISAVPNLYLSSGDNIRIEFSKEISKLKKGKVNDIFSFSPNIKGTTEILSDYSIVFTPSKRMKNGESFKGKINLGKLFDLKEGSEYFNFKFNIKDQAINISNNDYLLSSDCKTVDYKITFKTADVVEDKIIEKILKDSKNLKYTWSHLNAGREHILTFRDIPVGNKEKEYTVVWDASNFVKDAKQEKYKFTIDGSDSLNLIYAKAAEGTSKGLEIVFSDNIETSQDLRGLIEIENIKNLKFTILGNKILVYAPKEIYGLHKVKIYQGIKSVNGKSFSNTQTSEVSFKEILPVARFIGKATITPSRTDCLIPFEAVGLKAVDLRVIKIYNNNLHNFFQNNGYSGSSNLVNFGRLVLNKTISLENSNKDLTIWNDFRLDLNKYMKFDRSSLYRLELRFKQSNTISYAKGAKDAEYYDIKWVSSDWYSTYYTPKGYRWRFRNDPNHVSYYNYNHFDSRNVFYTNIGLVAKKCEDKSLHVFVTDLLSAKVIKLAKIKVYNFQKQIIAEELTDRNGYIKLNCKDEPFLISAEKDGNIVYLKVRDGNSLSVSNFDVSGETVRNGIKGYIYGERGVWRPGDDIHLGFILYDRNNILPEGHPISASLINARGQLIKTKVKYIEGKHKQFAFSFNTDKEAPTGTWIAKIKVGSNVFTKNLKVENIKPNRLKIKFNHPKVLVKGEKTDSNIEVKWLHGSPASNLTYDITTSFSSIPTNFKGYKSYIFSDQSVSLNANKKTSKIYNLDEKGIDKIDLSNICPKVAPGMLRANVLIRAYEKSGEYSVSYEKIKCSVYKSYVGFKLPKSDDSWYKTNENQKVRFVNLDIKGKPIKKGRVHFAVYKLSWSWWWDSDSRNIGSYVNRRYNRPVYEKTFSIEKMQSLNFKVKEYGRYYIKATNTETGQSSGRIVYFSRWGDSSDIYGSKFANILKVQLLKNKYKVGEEATVKFPSSEGGVALVSIESGTSVVEKFVVPTKGTTTSLNFTVTDKMSPNVYVNVTLIQKFNDKNNDNPIRMYGIASMSVESPNTFLNPIIKQKKELRPNQDFEVKVKERDGKAMKYTIAIVDEGLLGITGFKTPNPHNAFFKREALGVRTFDMYEDVIGAYGGRLEKAFAIGGDTSLSSKSSRRINRFKPVVIFKGPFSLKSGETKTHKLHLPNYIGAVRTMVVASNDSAFGSKEKTSEVKTPIMLHANLPRILTPGDEVKIPVTVFVMDNKIKNVSLKVKVDNKLKVLDNISQVLSFSEKGDKVAYISLKVSEEVGTSNIELIAKSGKETSIYNTDIEIRNPNPEISKVNDIVLRKGEKTKISINNIGIKGTNSHRVELSSIPSIDIVKTYDEIENNSYGNLERIVSKSFLNLYIGLFNSDKKANVKYENKVNSYINRIISFQKGNGALSYWRDCNYINEWTNVYALHFLTLAKLQGYSVPSSLYQKVISYSRNRASNWTSSKYNYYSDLTQAYRLYVLALSDSPNFGAMNRLRERSKLSDMALVQLSTAYDLLGKKDVADKLIERLKNKKVVHNEYDYYTFYSSLRDDAILLENYIQRKKDSKAYKQVVKMSKELSSEEYYSTISKSFAIRSIAAYYLKFKPIDSESRIALNYKDKDQKIVFKGSMQLINLENPASSSMLSVKNQGNATVYIKTISKGRPTSKPIEAKSSNISLDIRYTNEKGQSVDLNNLKVGQDIVAHIRIKNTSLNEHYSNLALTAMMPSAFEINNTRLYDVQSAYGTNGRSTNRYDYIDYRDDSVSFFFGLSKHQAKEFSIHLHVSYMGKYYLPSVICSSLYRNEVSARSASKTITIKQ